MKNRTIPFVFAVALAGFFLAIAGCGEDHVAGDEHGGHEEHAGEKGHEEHGAGHEEGEGGASEVTLTESQIKLAEIKTAPAARGEIHIELPLPGEVSLNQDRLAHIVPRVPGIVREVRKTLGARVRAGDVMAVVESSELGEAKAGYLEKKQQLDLARTDLDRARTVHDNTVKLLEFLKSSPPLESLKKMKHLDLGENRSALISTYSEVVFSRATYVREKDLFEKKISSGNEYLEAENAYKKAEAEFASARDRISFDIKRSLLETTRAQNIAAFSFRAAERQLHLLGLSDSDVKSLASGKETHEALTRYAIQAPFDGTVIEKHITQGEKVEDDADLYTLCNLETVWVICSVYEKDIARVKLGQAAGFSVKAYPDQSFTGKVTWIADTIDEETRTLKLRVEVDNKDRLLKPGMFAKVVLGVETKRNAITVPLSAIQRQKGEVIVFVAEGGGRFERREVSLGSRTASKVEIISGLQVGEKVVTSGSFILKSELEKAGFHAGHAH